MNVINQFRTFLHIVAQDAPPDIFSRYSNFCLSGGFTQFTPFPVLLGNCSIQRDKVTLKRKPLFFNYLFVKNRIFS